MFSENISQIHKDRMIGIALSWQEIFLYEKIASGAVVKSSDTHASHPRFEEGSRLSIFNALKSLAKKNLIILEIDGDTWTAKGLGE
jgi:hypothetical protein